MNAYVITVVLHVALATLWFAGGLFPSRILKSTRALGNDAFRVGAEMASHYGMLAGVGAIGAFVSGIAMIFVRYGGFSGLPVPFHIALTLVLLGVLMGLFGYRPLFRSLVELAEQGKTTSDEVTALIKRVSMMTGISHLLWLGALVCMFLK